MVLAVLAFIGCAREAVATSYSYTRVGNPQDIHTTSDTGTAMMGGGEDLDEAFRWLCAKGNKGDFLVLRATGDGSYNSYVNGLCDMNSVATLVIPDRRAARDPAVARIIGEAEVVFISGGDQANYIRGWQGTPVENAINAHIAAGKPVGGTSAGLAVLGEFIYGSLHDKPDENVLMPATARTRTRFRSYDGSAVVFRPELQRRNEHLVSNQGLRVLNSPF
jgi:cyanophycinase-like exopeptidase